MASDGLLLVDMTVGQIEQTVNVASAYQLILKYLVVEFGECPYLFLISVACDIQINARALYTSTIGVAHLTLVVCVCIQYR